MGLRSHLNKMTTSFSRILLFFSSLLTQLPAEHYLMLCYIVCLCRQIINHADVTRMTASNLAIVFGPNILRQRAEHVLTLKQLNSLTPEQRLEMANQPGYANQAVTYLIQNDVALFGSGVVSLIDNTQSAQN